MGIVNHTPRPTALLASSNSDHSYAMEHTYTPTKTYLTAFGRFGKSIVNCRCNYNG